MTQELDALNLDPAVRERVLSWAGPDFDAATRQEIGRLIAEKNGKELTDRFYKILEFGTGGLRGVMEAGTNRVNNYTIAMATQGLANTILRQTGDKSVVIAYDSRHRSDSFALKAALVLAGNGIRVYLFRGLRPTPELSFAVRHFKATAGIVITASHNPPEYNGYKVYWSDGAQIIAPHDKLIMEEVRKVSTPSQVRSLTRKEARQKGLLRIIGAEIDRIYLARVKELSVSPEIVRKHSGRLKIVYTPLYGAGYPLVTKSLKNYGFRKVFVVKEQARPDGNFPTAPFPNPEETASLRLGLALAEKKGADLLLATDPDADRLGIAVRDTDSGKMILLNGNQLGSILLTYLLTRLQEEGKIPANACVVKSIVTTDLAGRIAEHFGVKLFDVFTGFKYIASVIREHPDFRFLFGFEESYGFLAGDFVRDKDGVSAACLTAEAAVWAVSRQMTLLGFLDEIYGKFGFYQDKLKSLTLKGKEGMERIRRIMEKMTREPPALISGRKLLRTLDYQARKEKIMLEGKEVEWTYDLPQGSVLAFHYEGDLKITIRPSGTEPKIKYYFSVRREFPSSGDLQELKEETRRMLDGMESAFSAFVQAIP